ADKVRDKEDLDQRADNQRSAERGERAAELRPEELVLRQLLEGGAKRPEAVEVAELRCEQDARDNDLLAVKGADEVGAEMPKQQDRLSHGGDAGDDGSIAFAAGG